MTTYTVVSTMKNEAPFVLEWVAHYKALGFDHIVVATNDCQDGTVRMLRRLSESGIVRLHRTQIRSGGIHRSALRQAARYEEVQNADWIFVCDVDEFLNIHVGDGSIQALREHSGDDVDVISVPWRIFGPDGRSEFLDERVTKQFTKAELEYDEGLRPDTGKFVKSLYRNTDKVKRMGLHAPIAHDDHIADFKWVLPGGATYVRDGKRTSAPPTFEFAQVNHYALRSLDSYLVKRDRGRANHAHHTLGLDYWNKFNLNDAEDLSVRRYDARVEEFMDQFFEDFRLRKLHNAAVAWHSEKSADLRANPDLGPMIEKMESSL